MISFFLADVRKVCTEPFSCKKSLAVVTCLKQDMAGRKILDLTRVLAIRKDSSSVMPERGARPRQIDGPHVLKRQAGKKVVNPQRQPFELWRRVLWHRASFAVSLGLFQNHTRRALRAAALD